MITAFESTTCTRCGGTGEYSYCSMYGRTCFKCSGKGVTLTKRGAAASAAFSASLKISPADLTPGRKMYVPQSPFGAAHWVTIESVTRETEARSWSILPDGTRVPHDPGYRLVTDRGTHYVQDQPIRVNWTAEEKAPRLAAALALQASLTKAGTPRKAAAMA